MALSNSLKFVNQFITDREFRVLCNAYQSKGDLLNEQGFDEHEFENAINMSLVKCGTYEEAEYYQQVRMWMKLLK
jgi:hypothetical protein